MVKNHALFLNPLFAVFEILHVVNAGTYRRIMDNDICNYNLRTKVYISSPFHFSKNYRESFDNRPFAELLKNSNFFFSFLAPPLLFFSYKLRIFQRPVAFLTSSMNPSQNLSMWYTMWYNKLNARERFLAEIF